VITPVTRLLACLRLNVNVPVRWLCDVTDDNGSRTTMMTLPTTIYLDRDKASRTNTSNCPSRVRLTKKRKLSTFRLGDKRRAFRHRSSDSNRSISRLTIERYPKRCPFTTNVAYTRETYALEAECTYIFTITPRSLLYIFTTSPSLSWAGLVLHVAGPRAEN